MKLLDRILLWILSVVAVLLGVLLIVLVLFPGLAWLQAAPVRVAVGALALLGILSAVAIQLRRAPHRREEAALVNDDESGSAYVTLNVINDMAKRIAQECEGVRACKSAVKNNGSGVDVALELALQPGVAVAPMATMLQERLQRHIFEMTGIRVGKVSILVEAASEGTAPKALQEASVKQLPDRVQ